MCCHPFRYVLNHWRHGVVVITTAQLHSAKPELRFCTGSNPAWGMLETRDGEDLWQWSRLEIKLNAFRRSTIQKQFIIIIIIIISSYAIVIQYIKGCLSYKMILYHKVTFDVYLMHLFISRENNVLFWRCRYFCIFVKPADFKICDVIISIAA